jgi:hypothetical protein
MKLKKYVIELMVVKKKMNKEMKKNTNFLVSIRLVPNLGLTKMVM